MNRFNLNPHTMYAAVVGSPEYRRELSSIGLEHLTDDQKREARRTALAKGALQCAEKADDGNRQSSLEGDVYRLSAQFDDFLEAEITLSDLRSNTSSTRKDRLPYLEVVTAFNHTLRSIIDKGGHTLQAAELEQSLTQLFRITHDKQTTDYFSSVLSERLRGMKHEIGFEQVIGTFDDADYEPATLKQELYEGIDITVFYENSTIPIDIKASQFGVNKANKESPGGHKLTLWSGLTEADFNGSFRIPYDLAVQKSIELRKTLDTYLGISKRRAV